MAVAAITRQATCASSLARLRVSVQVTRSEVRALSLSCRRLVERPGQSPDLGGGLRSHDAELGQVAPQCIDDLRALAHQHVAGPKEHRPRLLPFRLDLHEVHGRSRAMLDKRDHRITLARRVLEVVGELTHALRMSAAQVTASREATAAGKPIPVKRTLAGFIQARKPPLDRE